MRSKKFASLTLLAALALLLSSCGNKGTNKVNSNTLGTGSGSIIVGTNPISTGGTVSSSTLQLIQQIESQASCQYGGQRIYKQFYTNSATGNMTTISANFQDGGMTYSGDGNVYVGYNYSSRDLLYVQKVTSGTSVVGYIATLSFCPIANVISSDRNLTGLQIKNMTLTNSTRCGYGAIDNASTLVYSVKDSSQPVYSFGCGGNSYPYTNPYIATYGVCTNFTAVCK